MRDELQRHKRSDSVKWVLTSIAFVLAFVMIAGLCLQLFGTGKFKPSNWFEKPDQTEQPTDGEQTTGGLVMPEETKGNGIALMSAPIAKENYEDYGISTQAETAYTITATVEPENATDKRVAWSVSWKNPSSTWASGKTVTNYVTITPTSANALTATLSCSQAFGEVVVLKVASVADSTVAVTREINYMKRATSFDCYISSTAGRGTLTVDKTGASASYLYCNPTYGVGTVTGTVSIPSATVTFNAAYCNMSSYITKANAAITSGAKVSAATSKTFSNPTSTNGGLALSWRDFFTADGGGGIFSIGSTAENHLKSGIVAMAKNGATGYGKVTANITISYGDVSASYSQETTITKFDVSALTVNPTNISYSNSSSLAF